MRKIFRHIRNHLKWFVWSVLASLLASILIMPYAVFLVKAFPNYLNNNIAHIVSTVLLAILIAIPTYKRFCNYSNRYKNTTELEKPPLIILDIISVFLAFVFIFSIILYYFQLDRNINLNPALTPYAISIILLTLLIVLYFCTILFLINKIPKKKKESGSNKNEDSSQYHDLPITRSEEDILDRGKFVETLYSQIITYRREEPFIFGVLGKWGEGKTSIRNLLQEKIKEKDNDEFFVINYDPWHYSDKQSILLAFYQQIEDAICEKYIYNDFTKTLNKYVKLISIGTNYSTFKFNLSLDSESLTQTKEKIERYIRKTEKKLLIMIDDIDRLPGEEILDIFKTIRLNADFRNTIYILFFDNTHVKKVLKENEIFDNDYLEKFIQNPINLPPIIPNDILEIISAGIEKIITTNRLIEEGVKDDLLIKFKIFFDNNFVKTIPTIRKAKRFINSLIMTLPPIIQEVNIYDFILMEILRTFYSDIYNDIWKNAEIYIDMSWGRLVNRSSFAHHFKLMQKSEEFSSRVQEHIDTLLENYNDGERETIQSILLELFTKNMNLGLNRNRPVENSEQARILKKVSHPSCFGRYFQYKIEENEIPDSAVEGIISTFNELEPDELKFKTKELLNDIINLKQKTQLLRKFQTFGSKFQHETIINLVRALYENISILGFEESAEDNTIRETIVYFILAIINSNLNSGELTSLVTEIVENIEDLNAMMTFVLSCKKERGAGYHSIYYSIEFDELAKTAICRLEKHYIDEGNNIFNEYPDSDNWQFMLYQWSTDFMRYSKKSNRKVNNYLKKIFTENSTYLASFLYSQKNTDYSRKYPLSYLERLKEAYDLAMLYDLSKKHQKNKQLNAEERKYLKDFIEEYEEMIKEKEAKE